MNGTSCVFEKPERRDGRRNEGNSNDGWGGDAEGRVTTLEKSVHDLASGQHQIQSTVSVVFKLDLTSSSSRFCQCCRKRVAQLGSI